MHRILVRLSMALLRLAAGLAEIIAVMTAEDRGKPVNVDGNVLPW